MPDRAAGAIVVGAGVVGAAIAFNLTRLGLRDVLLLERGTPGSGASDRSGALVRTHYTNAPEAQMALAAQRWFHHWADLVGGDSGFVRTGFLQFVAPADNEKLRQNVAMLRGVGVDTRLVTPDEVEDAFVTANPGLSREGIAVTCDSRRLSEVRICLTKGLNFRACPEIDRRACRNDKVVMPPVRGG